MLVIVIMQDKTYIMPIKDTFGKENRFCESLKPVFKKCQVLWEHHHKCKNRHCCCCISNSGRNGIGTSLSVKKMLFLIPHHVGKVCSEYKLKQLTGTISCTFLDVPCWNVTKVMTMKTSVSWFIIIRIWWTPWQWHCGRGEVYLLQIL